MTPLQARREEVRAAVTAHLARGGRPNWKIVRTQFPNVSPATFWRCVMSAKAALSGAGSTSAQSPASNPIGEAPADLSASRSDDADAAVFRDFTLIFDPYAGGFVKRYLAEAPAAAGDRTTNPPHDAETVARAVEASDPRHTTIGQLMAIYDVEVLSPLRTGADMRRS